MSETTADPNTTAATECQALLCRCAQEKVLPESRWRAVLDDLRGQGWNILVVDDLCGLSARRDPALGAFLAGTPRLVAACHPRAVRSLLSFAGFPAAAVEILDLRAPGPAPVRPETAPPAAAPGQAVEIAEPPDWVPWYPVIDRDRCQNCKQCQSFCMFGVYGDDGGGNVAVLRPANCKTHCPACSRICPHRAVIFPKFGESPFNGDAVPEETLAGENSARGAESMTDTELAAALAERRLRLRRKSFLAEPSGEGEP